MVPIPSRAVTMARLLLLGAVLFALAATVARPGALGAAAAARVTLSPDRGPCATRPLMRGEGFPSRANIVIFSERTTPPGEKRTQIASVVVEADGTFAATLLVIGGDCIDLDGRTPAGTRYGFTAAVAGMAGGPSASTVFTIDPTRPANVQCFSETNFCVQGRFLEYWLANGGLARNGFPLSAERREVLEDGRERTVQYFERARFELHPENGAPYDVLLGHFGWRILRERFVGDGARYQSAVVAVAPVAGRAYFPETGHTLGGRFREYWEANGGLSQFGIPLTEELVERLEDGREYRVQYFERARFEYHPENAAPYDILLGQFGRAVLAQAKLLEVESSPGAASLASLAGVGRGRG